MVPELFMWNCSDASGRNVFINPLSFPRGDSKSGPGLVKVMKVLEDVLYQFPFQE